MKRKKIGCERQTHSLFMSVWGIFTLLYFCQYTNYDISVLLTRTCKFYCIRTHRTTHSVTTAYTILSLQSKPERMENLPFKRHTSARTRYNKEQNSPGYLKPEIGMLFYILPISGSFTHWVKNKQMTLIIIGFVYSYSDYRKSCHLAIICSFSIISYSI